MADTFTRLLHTAAQTGDSLVLSKLLRRVPNLDINVRLSGEYGHAALSIAAKAGHSEIVRMLLDAGANINMFDAFHVTALHLAATTDRVAVVKHLLSRGADANIKTINGMTALDLAGYRTETWKLIYDYTQRGLKPVAPRITDVVPVIPPFAIPKPSLDDPHPSKKTNKKKDKKSKKRK